MTAWEVIKNSPAKNNYPGALICEHIGTTEFKLFNSCYLGLDFYYKLIENLNDVSAAVPFDANTAYSKGARVIYEGCILESIINNNIIHPINDSNVTPAWSETPKFKDSCLQELWDNHLKHWLAFNILKKSLRYSTHQMGAKGAVKFVNDETGIGTVNYKELVALRKNLQSDADDTLEVLYSWVLYKRKQGVCTYPDIIKNTGGCLGEDCPPPAKRRQRRWYFRQ